MRDVAVALLLDSSATLLNEWPNLLTRYIPALLGRLHNTEYTFSVSVVTYSTADYRPSPIVTKRYFNIATLVLKEVKEEPLKLGVGLTGNAGRHGTAALDGYAAVIEMFDLFLKSHSPSRHTPHEKAEKVDSEVHAPLCHILHICATHPDDAKRPLWNSTTPMDSLTWASLPEELRKRDINLNLILLKPNILLSEVHSNATTSPFARPFFPIQNGYTILMSSESSWTSLSGKRQTEIAQATKTPDAKRARTQTPSTAAGTTQTLANVPPATALQGTQQSTMPQQQLTRAEAIKKLYETLKLIESLIQKDQMEIQNLLSQNRTAEVEVLKQNMAAKQVTHQKLKARLLQTQKMELQSASGGGIGAQPVPPLGIGQNALQGQASRPSNEPNAQFLQLQQLQLLQQARNQTQQLNATKNTATNIQNMPFNPSVVAQMQKLQMKEGIQGLQSQGHAELQQQSLQPPMFGGMPATQVNAQAPGPLPVPQQQISSWMGVLAFKAPQPAEIQLLLSCEKQNLRPELWPPKLELVFSPAGAFDVPTLKLWMQRHNPAICKAKLIPRMADPAGEEQQYRHLLRVLNERNAYAYASWLNPRTGSNKPMLCFFATGGNNGVAAVFPETGIPELPQKAPPTSASQVKPGPQQPPPSAGPASNALSAQVARYLQQSVPANLPPEQRNAFLNQKLREVMLKFQAHYQPNAANAANANNTSTNALHLSQGPPAQQNQPQSGMNPFNNLGSLSGMGGMGFSPGGGSYPSSTSNPSMGGSAPQQWNVSNVPSTSAGAGSNMGGGMPNMNMGVLNNMNFTQALAAMQQQQQRQQQMQGGMGAPPSSEGQQGPFMR